MKKLLTSFLSRTNQVKWLSPVFFILLLTQVGQAQNQNPFSLNSYTTTDNYYQAPQPDQQEAALQWETISSLGGFSYASPIIGLGKYAYKPPSADLDQVRNGSAAAPDTNPTGAAWVNGNAGSSNAHYAEGLSIPYRVVMVEMPAGTHWVEIEWDIKHSSANAIDFITHYDLLDYPAGIHATNFGHTKEVINPLKGLEGTVTGPGPDAGAAAPSQIIKPNLPVALGTAGNTFDAIKTAGLAYMSMWGATITGMSYVVPQGDLAAAQSATRLRINFTVTAGNTKCVLSWGGHIAKATDWGPGNSAGGISGSPYHTRLINWDLNNLGNQDRSLSADAVIAPPPCGLTTPSIQCPGSSSTIGNSVMGVVVTSVPSGQTYNWKVSGNGTLTSSSTAAIASVMAGGACGQAYNVTLTIRTTSGLFLSECYTSVMVGDNTNPTIGSAGASTTVECPATPPSFTAPTGSDNCGTPSIVEVSDVSQAGCGSTYTRTKTWVAVDGCGNSSATRSQTIAVVDNTAPNIGSPGASTTVEGCPATFTPTFTAPTANDACQGSITPTPVSTVTSGSSCVKTHTRTWRAVDACGNSSGTVAQSITVQDKTAPTIGSAGASTTIEGCPNTSPTFTAPTANDNCDGSVTPTPVSTVTSGTACNRTTTRVWQAVDGCGNSSVTRSQSITIQDTKPPLITSCPADVTVECGSSTEPGATGTATATDECGDPVVTKSDAENSVGCQKVITRTWKATDGCNNTSTCVQYIIVIDKTPPVINCGTTVTATDNCSASNKITLFEHNGTWTAIDEAGNVSQTTCPSAPARITTQVTSESMEQTPPPDDGKSKNNLPPGSTTKPNLTDELKIQAVPNPFNNSVKFVVFVPQSGYASLDVMNMVGQKLKTVYQGQLAAGVQSFEMSMPASRAETLIYTFRVGDKMVTGKLVQVPR